MEHVVNQKTKELNVSYENYHSLFDQAADGILVGNFEGIIIDANNSICSLAGYTKEEFVGQHIRILFDENELAENPLRFDLLNKGETVKLERYFKTKKGSFIPVEMISRKLPDGRLQAFVRDITDRKQAEELLLYKDKVLEGIANSAKLLLKNKDINVSLKEFFAEIGQTFNVSNICLLQIDPKTNSSIEKQI